MPELPDIVVYLEALERQLGGRRLESVSLKSPFLLRTFEPPLESVRGPVVQFSRMGKRVLWHLEDGTRLVFHLMIAGRFHWKSKIRRPTGRHELAAFQFEHGTMMLTEVSSKKRASLHVMPPTASLAPFDRHGLEILDSSEESFAHRLQQQNRTLKRALTDPTIFSGIGNAYSDEILWSAKLSPFLRTQQLDSDQVNRLHRATVDTMQQWIERLRQQTGDRFPEKVTAFRPEMAVHGKYQEPCPECDTAIQRIRYAENECNYCPRCQTGGKLLADRSLSRLLKDDWPRTIDELEQG